MADDKRIRIVGGTVGIDGLGATSMISTPQNRSIEYAHPIPPFSPPPPDFPPFFVASAVSEDDASTDFHITVPAGSEENDLLVLHYWARKDSNIVSGLEDWTLIEELEKVWDPFGGFFVSNHHFKAYYKYASVSETGSYHAITSVAAASKLAAITLFRSASLFSEFVIENSSASLNASEFAQPSSGFRSSQEQLDPQNDNSMLVYAWGYSRASNNNMIDSYVDDNAYWFGNAADNRNFTTRAYNTNGFLGLTVHAHDLTSSLDQYGDVQTFISVGTDTSGISFVIRGTTTGSI